MYEMGAGCMKPSSLLSEDGIQHHLPFLSNPALEVGIPVSRANFCFTCVIPRDRFKEKLTLEILNIAITTRFSFLHAPIF